MKPWTLLPLFGSTLGNMRRYAPGIIGYGLAFYALRAAIYLPLQSAILRALIERSGTPSVANFDLVSFVLTPTGILWLVSALTIGLTLLTLQQAGTLLQAIAGREGRRLSVGEKLRYVIRSAPRILSISLIPILLLLLSVLLFGAWLFLLQNWFLSAHDINFYLAERPPEFWQAVLLAALGAGIILPLVCTIIVAWTVSLPRIVGSDGWWMVPLRDAWKAAKGSRRRVLLPILVWALVVAVGIALLSTALLWAAGLFVGLFGGSDVALLLSTGFALVMVDLALGLTTLVAVAGYSFLTEEMSHRTLGKTPLPPLPSGGDRKALVSSRLWIAMGIVGIAAASFGSAYALIATISTAPQPLVVAHRGSSIRAPENTMSAFDMAVEEGADVIELDVQQTSDNEVVVLHDKDVLRMTGMAGSIWQMTSVEVAALTVAPLEGPPSNAEPIPTLGAVIERIGARTPLFVELKINGHNPDLVVDTVEMLAASHSPYRHSIISLDASALAEVERIDPSFRTGLLVTASIGDMTALDIDFLAIAQSFVTPRLLRHAKTQGLPIYVWTVNDETEMTHLIEMGVDGIITDDPSLLRDVLSRYSSLSTQERLMGAIARWLSQG